MSVPANGKPQLKAEVEAVESCSCVPADLLLICSDGVGVKTHSQIVMLASSVLRATNSKTLKVEGSSAAWRLALEQLYPLHPRPELTFSSVHSMLRIVAAYDMASLLAHILAFLRQRFPAELSPEPTSPTYLITWLVLADELQLDDLRHMCMQKLRGLAYSGNLEHTLLQRVSPSTRLSASADSSSGGSAPTLPSTASLSSSSLVRRESLNGSRSDLHQRDASSGNGGSNESTYAWHQDDRPELHDSLRLLSRSTLEELLASLALAASKRYQNRSREDKMGVLVGSRTPGAAAVAAAMADGCL